MTWEEQMLLIEGQVLLVVSVLTRTSTDAWFNDCLLISGFYFGDS